MMQSMPRALLLLALAGSALQAQVVGRLPTQAVFRDTEDPPRIGVFAGWLTTGLDPVGFRGKSAPIVGLRYDVLLSSPAYFSLRMFGVSSEHDVYDATKAQANRLVGTAPTRQLGVESAIELSLTGTRTWHGVQPLIRGGVGFIAGVGNQFDQGGFATGASVLYSYGMGLRFPTGKNGEFRADGTWMIYQVRYPEHFRTTARADDTPLRASGSLTPFTTNRALTVSYSWGMFR